MGLVIKVGLYDITEAEAQFIQRIGITHGLGELALEYRLHRVYNLRFYLGGVATCALGACSEYGWKRE